MTFLQLTRQDGNHIHISPYSIISVQKPTEDGPMGIEGSHILCGRQEYFVREDVETVLASLKDF